MQKLIELLKCRLTAQFADIEHPQNKRYGESLKTSYDSERFSQIPISKIRLERLSTRKPTLLDD